MIVHRLLYPRFVSSELSEIMIYKIKLIIKDKFIIFAKNKKCQYNSGRLLNITTITWNELHAALSKLNSSLLDANKSNVFLTTRSERWYFMFEINSEYLCFQLIKVDIVTRTTKTWSEVGVFPSEPIFVPFPDPQVIISSITQLNPNPIHWTIKLHGTDGTGWKKPALFRH